MVVPSMPAAIKAEENLSAVLTNRSVGFKTKIIVSEGKSFWEIIKRESADTDLVTGGFKFNP